MKFIKIITKGINVTVFSIVFILITTTALTPSSSEESGMIGYFNLTNLLFYTGYILFGIALLQYIRNKSVDWHNVYLVFVLILICWFVLMVMFLSPFFDELFSDDGDPQSYYAVVIEFIMNMSNEMEKSDTPPDYFYDYLLNFIVTYNLGVFCAIILAIPFSIYTLSLVLKRYLEKEIRKKWLVSGSIIITLIGTGILYLTVFGEITSSVLATYKKRIPKTWESELTFTEKMSNINFAEDQIIEFGSQLYINPIAIISNR